jgi:hypothetical protein
VNTQVNTPRKILLKISPIPEIPQGKDSERKQSTTALTSKDCLAKKNVRSSSEKKSWKIRENQWDVFVKRNQGNLARIKKN